MTDTAVLDADLAKASEHGSLTGVQAVFAKAQLSGLSPSGLIRRSEALVIAATNGHLDVIRCLLARIPSPECMSQALLVAAAQDRLDVLRLLIDECTSAAVASAFVHAAHLGRAPAAAYLQPSCSRQAINLACAAAAESGHYALVAQLLPAIDPDQVVLLYAESMPPEAIAMVQAESDQRALGAPSSSEKRSPL